MKEYCIIDKKHTNSIINLLKLEIDKELKDKYWISITPLHWIASYLDPTIKDLLLVTDISYLAEQKEAIKEDIHILAKNVKHLILDEINRILDLLPRDLLPRDLLP